LLQYKFQLEGLIRDCEDWQDWEWSGADQKPEGEGGEREGLRGRGERERARYLGWSSGGRSWLAAATDPPAPPAPRVRSINTGEAVHQALPQ
jgi:hypothetical protein